MIAFAAFLFALLVVAWLLMPDGERQVQLEFDPAAMQPEAPAA